MNFIYYVIITVQWNYSSTLLVKNIFHYKKINIVLNLYKYICMKLLVILKNINLADNSS